MYGENLERMQYEKISLLLAEPPNRNIRQNTNIFYGFRFCEFCQDSDLKKLMRVTLSPRQYFDHCAKLI